MPAKVRTSQTPTTWTRTTVELVRGLMCSRKKKPYHNVPRQSPLIFSIFLHQILCRKVQSIFETTSTKSEAYPTMPCISLVIFYSPRSTVRLRTDCAEQLHSTSTLLEARPARQTPESWRWCACHKKRKLWSGAHNQYTCIVVTISGRPRHEGR